MFSKINNAPLQAMALLLALCVLSAVAYIVAGLFGLDPALTAGGTFASGLLLAAAAIVVIDLFNSFTSIRTHKAVASAMGRLAAGDHSVRLEPGFGVNKDLVSSFNSLASGLKDRLETMEAEIKRGKDNEQEALRLQKESSRLGEEVIKVNADLLRKEVMLEQINQELLAASRVKTEFTSNMGRELVTPLNSIIGLADFIDSGSIGGLNQKQKEYILNIRQSAKSLLDVVENILQYTLLEMGETINREEFPLRQVAQDVVNSLGPMAASHNVTLALEAPDETIWADRKKFRFILTDLLHNAIKFNKPGGKATLRAYRVDGNAGGELGAAQDAGYMEFQVEDTGSGFSQLPGIAGGKLQGAGLSLAIVKKYVELHDGRVWAESRPGAGSRFSFTLPAARTLPGRKGKKLLVVEDDPDQMALISSYFAKEPYELLKAKDGIDALRVVEEAAPDLILLDVLLPRMDGLEVCKTLKRQEKFQRFRHIPVVMITSLEDLGSKVKGVQAGADDFLVKPLDKGLLIERMKSLAGAKEEYEKMLASYRNAEQDCIMDPLTGLYNRRYLEEVLDKEIKYSERYKRNLSVLMMDIDFFKNFNDRYGHQEGDRLLKKMAGIFRETVREVDVVARYGGEEFMVILPDTPPDMASMVAERVRQAVEAAAGATISIGMATYPGDAGDKDKLVQKSDIALYKAKGSGRNRVVKYRPEDDFPVSGH